MAKKKYTVSSPEGAEYAGVEQGETVTLDLSEREETAVIAAGWISHETKPKEASK